ncbi:ABC transporter permease [Chelatococcus asaccharovorans]|uniref:Sulfonate transport system permease protein n=1 Tax=Chelatococcus asaccharovorans TaxID=28210 RepID=A0A2V3UGG3_9HYPH|nr:ABC transporter permease [Chelatococcus asaccharovorans]MBS7703776.1 ABC transporter permease [Chelatococcus asaccharovorans]PXW57936.1 sulfonate transport system permease protein [Chelatococcus asaccharovorans]
MSIDAVETPRRLLSLPRPTALAAPLAGALRRAAPTVAWGLVLPAVALPGWYLAARSGVLPEQILPAPAYVWSTFVDMVRSGELASHAGISLLRVVEGFGLGMIIGLVAGAAMGLSRRVDDMLHPFFIALSQVPTLAWIPFLMLLVGIGEPLKILVIVKATLVPVVINTRAGIRNIPKGLLEVGDVLRFTTGQKLRLIVLPGTVPPVFTGIRYGLTHAWIALVSVELLASSEGLGYLLVWGRQMFWLDTVVVGMIVIGLIGYVSDRLLASVEARLQRWAPRHD